MRGGRGKPGRPPIARAETNIKPKVLLVLRENSSDLGYMLRTEVGVMVAMLEAAGLAVVTASESGRPMGEGIWKIKPELKLSDVRMADYVGLLLPSLAVGLVVPVPAKLIKILRRAVALETPVAAQHGSVVVLQRSGVLKKKKYAFERPVFGEGEYAGTGVVRDGKLITSGTCPHMARETGRPDGTETLIRLFVEAIADCREGNI
jgi:putative intracellular protease/amidase